MTWILLCVAFGLAQADEASPAWAYAIAPLDDGDPTPLTLPGSTRTFTRAQLTNPFEPADWYPGDHPAMPRIVSHGRAPLVFACAFCHHPNGQGRPENAGIAGLPKGYIVQQMRDFRDGLRHSALAFKGNTRIMVTAAQVMTDAEIESAAAYFSAMPWRPWIRVVETDTVPTTDLKLGMYVVRNGARAGTEPIAARIVEVPEDENRSEYRRDPRSGFVAYVPVGSVVRGAALVNAGEGRTTPCSTCHGEHLDGLGDVPGIGGRSPSYLARQLYDFREGTRMGRLAAQMRPVVERLSVDDIRDVSAYLASLRHESASGGI
jgi:cytochrome c553